MSQFLDVLVELQTKTVSPKLELGLTSIFGNLATYGDKQGRQQMVAAGVVDVLKPIMLSSGWT
jgi:hypothetical protein